MKFAVWDYSQVKIAQFNSNHPELAIDPTDIFIFTWFKGFATKSKSRSKAKDEAQKGMWTKTIDGVDYFNVRYEAIIKDFPILSFSSVKSIQRRFDKYVAAGIFEKKIIHAGKKGNYTYFAFTDLFWSFEYDNDNPEHKQVSVDNSVQTKQVSVDNSVQTKQVGVDNSVQTLIYNPTTSLNNPSTTSSNSEIINTSQKYFEPTESEEEDFNKTIIKLFGYNPHFSPNPIPVIKKAMDLCNITSRYIADYCEWLFKKLKPKCKNPANFINYFYKSCTAEVYISEYAYLKQQEVRKTEERNKNQIICPICGTKHDKNDYVCPNEDCKFPQENLNNTFEILKAKHLITMKKNEPVKFNEYQEMINRVYEQYPITERFRNKDKQIEFENRLAEIDSQFLNIENRILKAVGFEQNAEKTKLTNVS